jgi:hypothetical protein
VDPGAGEPLPLDLPRALDTLGDFDRILSILPFGKLPIFNRRNFNMDVDAVEERP